MYELIPSDSVNKEETLNRHSSEYRLEIATEINTPLYAHPEKCLDAQEQLRGLSRNASNERLTTVLLQALLAQDRKPNLQLYSQLHTGTPPSLKRPHHNSKPPSAAPTATDLFTCDINLNPLPPTDELESYFG